MHLSYAAQMTVKLAQLHALEAQNAGSPADTIVTLYVYAQPAKAWEYNESMTTTPSLGFRE